MTDRDRCALRFDSGAVFGSVPPALELDAALEIPTSRAPLGSILTRVEYSWTAAIVCECGGMIRAAATGVRAVGVPCSRCERTYTVECRPLTDPCPDSFQWCRFTDADGVEHVRVGAVHLVDDVPHASLILNGESVEVKPTDFGPVVAVPASFDGEPSAEDREAFGLCGDNLQRAIDMKASTGDELVACALELHGVSNPWATEGGDDDGEVAQGDPEAGDPEAGDPPDDPAPADAPSTEAAG